MRNNSKKDAFEKVIILISTIILFGVLGFVAFKLIRKDSNNKLLKEDSVGWFRVIDDDKYGVIGENGEEIVPCIYKAIGPFEEGLAVVVDDQGKYGYVNVDGKFVIPCRYERAYNFNDGWGRVCLNDKYYFIDAKGNFVFKEGYEYVYEYSCGIARIYQDGKFGYIDKKGKLITPLAYDKAWDFEDGYATVISGQDMYIIDTCGKRKTYERYQAFQSLEKGDGKGTLAQKKGKWGYIDFDENILLDFIFDEIRCNADYSGDESYLLVRINNKYGAFDYDAHCLIPPEYDHIVAYWGSFPSICIKDEVYGLAQVPDSFKYDRIDRIWGTDSYVARKDGKYGVIDQKGNTNIPFKYNWISENFSDGVYVVVFEDNICGLINESGKQIRLDSIDAIEEFSEGIAAFCVEDKYGFIDKDGTVIIDAIYDDADNFSEGFAAVKLNGKYGYINTDGKPITGFRYDKAYEFNHGTAIVTINGNEWLVGSSGELLTRRPYYFIGYRNSNSFPDPLKTDNSRTYDSLMWDYDLNRRR